MFDVDSDAAFTQTHQQAPARNYGRFYPKWVRNNFLSKQEGKEVGETRDYVMIISPGNPKSEVHQLATDAHKREFPEAWAAYLEGREQRISGTPIEVLPGLAQGVVDMLKSLYIYTIEQMAHLSDGGLQKVGMGGNELRQRAKAYLESNTREVVELREQLAQRDATIAELQRRLNQQPAPRGRGRPRKVAAA